MDLTLCTDDFQFNPLSLPNGNRPSESPASATFPIDPLFTVPQAQSIAALPAPGAKRKLELLDPTLNPSERARLEAEEDKRRRNTAASARFRVKKKQREQALEKSAKEMTEKANKLEKRVHELELENKWLKGLITEKTGGKEFSDLFSKFLSENSESSSHSEEEDTKVKI
jgi:Basic region leucine zipper